MKKIVVSFLFLSTAFAIQSRTPKMQNKTKETFTLTSDAFTHDGTIPSKHTCDGQDISPELTWSNAPDKTKTFALIVDDPDAPKEKPWVHWVVFNIPSNITNLKEGVQLSNLQLGMTDFGKKGWGGPCPPSGTHRYFFKLYALDTQLKLPQNVDKEALLGAMKGHILGQAELMGTYKRTKK